MKLWTSMKGYGTYIGGVAAILHGVSAIILEVMHGQLPDQLSVMEVIGGFTAIRMRMAIK